MWPRGQNALCNGLPNTLRKTNTACVFTVSHGTMCPRSHPQTGKFEGPNNCKWVFNAENLAKVDAPYTVSLTVAGTKDGDSRTAIKSVLVSKLAGPAPTASVECSCGYEFDGKTKRPCPPLHNPSTPLKVTMLPDRASYDGQLNVLWRLQEDVPGTSSLIKGVNANGTRSSTLTGTCEGTKLRSLHA